MPVCSEIMLLVIFIAKQTNLPHARGWHAFAGTVNPAGAAAVKVAYNQFA